jgi:hypothetical protein
MRRGGVIKSVLVAASLGAVATAATALSVQPPPMFDQGLTLAGGATAVDPDAPIATARYGDAPRNSSATVHSPTPSSPPSPVDLAGAVAPLAGGPVSGPASSPATTPVQIAQAAPSPKPAIQTLAEPRKYAMSGMVRTSQVRAPALGLVRSSERPFRVTKVEDIEIQPFSPPGQQTVFKRLSVDASALMGKISTSTKDAHRGRWTLFAASSGKALSMNVIRDSMGSWRGAGLSQDRLAGFGTHQVGLGWRKGSKQLSLSATRRKLRAQDYSERDIVYGFSLSIKPKR